MRLTNGIRESVEAKILNDRYREGEAQNKRDQQTHAIKLHEATYPNGLVDVGEWVPVTGYVYVNTPTRKRHTKNIQVDHALFHKRGNSIYLEEDGTFKTLFDQEEAFAEARVKDGQIIRAVLFSCSTTKQLIETAPELEKYLPNESGHVGNALVDMATVNEFRRMLNQVS